MSTDRERAQKVVEEARLALLNGQYYKAAEKYKEAISLLPEEAAELIESCKYDRQIALRRLGAGRGTR